MQADGDGLEVVRAAWGGGLAEPGPHVACARPLPAPARTVCCPAPPPGPESPVPGLAWSGPARPYPRLRTHRSSIEQESWSPEQPPPEQPSQPPLLRQACHAYHRNQTVMRTAKRTVPVARSSSPHGSATRPIFLPRGCHTPMADAIATKQSGRAFAVAPLAPSQTNHYLSVCLPSNEHGMSECTSDPLPAFLHGG